MVKGLKLFVLLFMAVGVLIVASPKAHAFDLMSSLSELSDSIADFFEEGEGDTAYPAAPPLEEGAESYEENVEEESAPVEEESAKFHPKDLEVTILNKEGERFRFDVELALTHEQHKQGLMNRESLPETDGMLFIFKDGARRNFWMKDTLIPLDIIFIKKNGVIDHIHSMAKPLDKSFITSPHESWAVLEINGGLSDQLGIAPGDMIYHPVFRNLNRLEGS
jgi:uncharacterized membrane protein (UPF0127 family)